MSFIANPLDRKKTITANMRELFNFYDYGNGELSYTVATPVPARNVGAGVLVGWRQLVELALFLVNASG